MVELVQMLNRRFFLLWLLHFSRLVMQHSCRKPPLSDVTDTPLLPFTCGCRVLLLDGGLQVSLTVSETTHARTNKSLSWILIVFWKITQLSLVWDLTWKCCFDIAWKPRIEFKKKTRLLQQFQYSLKRCMSIKRLGKCAFQMTLVSDSKPEHWHVTEQQFALGTQDV